MCKPHLVKNKLSNFKCLRLFLHENPFKLNNVKLEGVRNTSSIEARRDFSTEDNVFQSLNLRWLFVIN